jgi:hypothetical protein
MAAWLATLRQAPDVAPTTGAVSDKQGRPRPGSRRFILPVPSLSKGAAVREGPTCRGEALPDEGEDGPSVTQQAPTYPTMQSRVPRDR